MTRTYSNIVDRSIQALLDTIADKHTEPALYQDTMTKIGMLLGSAVLSQISDTQGNVYLACTVEDADFLAKGMLISLEKDLQKVAFACFWNHRFSPFEIEDLKVAPIIKKYQEPVSQSVNYLIIVKSIISGACVVKTNIVDLIQSIEPEKIFIVAPVMYFEAEEKLKSNFDKSIYDKFQFFYFAKDDERTHEGEVIPGVGGNVYTRLGFEGQESKNQFIPEIVKSRRRKLTKV
ncbi:hypothetical protein [Scytonema millei]|uniref:Uncharacterized protein n=1 Tax=Scytonema millei VB511283 TaxID=1245923 RepID=A0A9X5E343_9CYAN|nr:hypothetical protein [Scytonema millei]NHC34311.1 hypothetical protein [Scytonema millei VB511283]